MKKLLMSLLMLALLSVGTLSVAFAQGQSATTPTTPKPTPTPQTLVTVTGTVSNIQTPKRENTAVMFTLTVDAQTIYHVTSAPDAVLKKKGLTLADAAKVSVTGMTNEHLDKHGAKTLTAHDITMDGKTCELIGDKGKKTWTNDDIAPAITVSGKITDLVTPEGAAPGAPALKGPQNVTFTLNTEKGDLKFSYRPGKHLNLTLTNGQQITASYWQFQGVDTLILHDVTINGTTSTINDGTPR